MSTADVLCTDVACANAKVEIYALLYLTTDFTTMLCLQTKWEGCYEPWGFGQVVAARKESMTVIISLATARAKCCSSLLCQKLDLPVSQIVPRRGERTEPRSMLLLRRSRRRVERPL